MGYLLYKEHSWFTPVFDVTEFASSLPRLTEQLKYEEHEDDVGHWGHNGSQINIHMSVKRN